MDPLNWALDLHERLEAVHLSLPSTLTLCRISTSLI